MQSGISDIAREATSCPDGYARQQYLEELEATCSPRRISELLSTDPDAPAQKAQSRRALRLLQKAAVAAARGNAVRCERLRAQASEIVEKDEITALVEEYRLSFIIPTPIEEPQPWILHGFAD